MKTENSNECPFCSSDDIFEDMFPSETVHRTECMTCEAFAYKAVGEPLWTWVAPETRDAARAAESMSGATTEDLCIAEIVED